MKGKAEWDFRNLRVSIPITERMAEKVKEAIENKEYVDWHLNVKFYPNINIPTNKNKGEK